MVVIEIGPNLQRVLYLLIVLLFIDVFIIYFIRLLGALKDYRMASRARIEDIRGGFSKGYSDILTKLLMKKQK